MQVPDVVLWLLMCEIVIDLNENGAIYQEQLTTRKLSPENWTAGWWVSQRDNTEWLLLCENESTCNEAESGPDLFFKDFVHVAS